MAHGQSEAMRAPTSAITDSEELFWTKVAAACDEEMAKEALRLNLKQLFRSQAPRKAINAVGREFGAAGRRISQAARNTLDKARSWRQAAKASQAAAQVQPEVAQASSQAAEAATQVAPEARGRLAQTIRDWWNEGYIPAAAGGAVVGGGAGATLAGAGRRPRASDDGGAYKMAWSLFGRNKTVEQVIDKAVTSGQGEKVLKELAKRLGKKVVNADSKSIGKALREIPWLHMGLGGAGLGLGAGAVINATKGGRTMDKTAALDAVRREIFWNKVAEYIEKQAGPLDTAANAIRNAGSRALGFGRSLFGQGMSRSAFEKMLATARAEKAALGGRPLSNMGEKMTALIAEAKAKGLKTQQISDLLASWAGGTPKIAPEYKDVLTAWNKVLARRRAGAAIAGGAALLGGGAAYATGQPRGNQ